MSQHSDELIERCAKALCDNMDEIPGFWDELDARGKEEFRALARAVLDEAAKPAPGGPKMREVDPLLRRALALVAQSMDLLRGVQKHGSPWRGFDNRVDQIHRYRETLMKAAGLHVKLHDEPTVPEVLARVDGEGE